MRNPKNVIWKLSLGNQKQQLEYSISKFCQRLIEMKGLQIIIHPSLKPTAFKLSQFISWHAPKFAVLLWKISHGIQLVEDSE